MGGPDPGPAPGRHVRHGRDRARLRDGRTCRRGWPGAAPRSSASTTPTGQLATARRLAAEHGVALTLIHGNAETVPYPDGSFDFAVSEYGAAIWCDPYVWIPEAHRLLRPGGTLVFLGTSTLATLCSPLDGSVPTTEAARARLFTIHRLDLRDAVDEPGGIDFNLPLSRWFRLFRETGFDVFDLLEIQAPEPTPESESEVRFFVTAEWAHRFPSEQVWVLRRAATTAACAHRARPFRYTR